MSLTVGAEFAGYGGAELGLSQDPRHPRPRRLVRDRDPSAGGAPMSEPTYQLDADEIAALEAAEELVTMHRAQDINLAQHARLAAFVTTWHGGWERDETDEADDHHSERADQEAWT